MFGFSAQPRPWLRGWSPDRLGGWLSRRFGPITLLVEFNSQCPQKHLNLADMQQMGNVLVQSSAAFLSSEAATGFLDDVDSRRLIRQNHISKFRAYTTGDDAIAYEAELGKVPATEVANQPQLIERWIP
jgi:hypothetical protein